MGVAPTASSADGAQQRSWLRQHKLLVVSSVLILLVVAGFFVWGWPLVRLRFDSQYRAALNAVQNSPAVVEVVGQPIDAARPFPGGNVHTEGDRGEAYFYFDVAGPKGTAKVSAKSRRMMGQWTFTQVEVEFENKKKIDISGEINAGQDDVPRFDPNAKQSAAKEPDMPIEIKLPDLPQEAGK